MRGGDEHLIALLKRQEKWVEIGVPTGAVLMISVGELSVRKNHKVVVQALQELPENYWYVIVGKGDLKDELKASDHTGRLKLLGYRTDIVDLLHSSDLFVFPSLQEGLPVALMEAMASGLSCVCSRIRGNTDLIDEEWCLFDPNVADEIRNAINTIDKDKLMLSGQTNLDIVQRYSIWKVNSEMQDIIQRHDEVYRAGSDGRVKAKGVAMKKIVIIRSNYVAPDSRVEKEANSLTKAGYEVTLLTWNRSANYKICTDEKALQDTVVKRISFGLNATFGDGLKNLKPYLKFQWRLFWWLIKNKKEYDLCHCCDFDTANTASIACRLSGKRYIFDIFDYLSTDAKTLPQKLIKKREDSIINHADAVIICTEQRRNQIQGCKPNNLTVLHNSPAHMPHMGSVQEKSDKIRIAYVGILQEGRLLKEIVQAVEQMPNIELHIGGFGKYEEFMIEQATNYSNIFYYGKLSYDKTLMLENDCDLMTAIYDPAIGNHRYAAPNKFYEALYLGKPLIMVRDTGMSDVIEQEQIGVLIDYSEQGFKEGVEKLLARQFEWELMGEKMKRLYEHDYSWAEMEERLLDLYKKLEN